MGERIITYDEVDLACRHCGLPAERPLYQKQDKLSEEPFCCYGCMSVFNLLNSKGLQEFYSLRAEMGLFGPKAPAAPIEGRFDFLDEENFRDDHVFKYNNGDLAMRFYLEGINCIACLWLIERVPDFVESIKSAHLDLSTSVLTLSISSNGKFSEGTRLIAAMGFKPSPLKLDEGHQELEKKEDRRDLIKIGIAAAASMNIMLYSIALYAGAPQSYGAIFSAIIVVFAVPVIFYSATPFYTHAWASLRQRKLSLDVPIAFALLYGTMRGFIEIYTGGVEYYFDTLTILVFLLLLSRFVVKKWGRRGLALDSLGPLISSGPVEVKAGEHWVECHPDYLKVGDQIRVRPGQVLPADGKLISDSVYFQTAMHTGESIPREVVAGEDVFAGYQNGGVTASYSLTAVKEKTRLGLLLEEVRRGAKTHSLYSTLADRVVTKLVPAVFLLAGLIILYFSWTGNILEGERRALSLIIITCPCALALATPLALGRSLNLSRYLGIIMKDESLLERLKDIDKIVLDKTGTLTKGEFELLEENFTAIPRDLGRKIILALEKNSEHPLAEAFRSSWGDDHDSLELDDVTEVLGRGVSGVYQGVRYFIGKSHHGGDRAGEVTLGLYKDGEAVAHFKMGDELRPDAVGILNRWKRLGLELWILSGDRQENVNVVGEELGLDQGKIKGNLLPTDKAEIVERLKNSLMVGDGANDSLVLRKATIGVAVKGSMELALKSSDIFLTRPGLKAVDELLILSWATVSLIKRNLKFSLAYNVAGVTLATMGLINPLTAAIIMPLSSLSVVCSTVWGNRALRSLSAQNKGIHVWKS